MILVLNVSMYVARYAVLIVIMVNGKQNHRLPMFDSNFPPYIEQHMSVMKG